MNNTNILRQRLRTEMPWLKGMKTSVLRFSDTVRFMSRGLRYLPIRKYLYIDGWLTYGEAIGLYELAQGLPSEHPVIVELGSWLGKSSVILAKAIEGKRDPVIYCIDPFDATDDGVQHDNYVERKKRMARPLVEIFIENMKKNGVYGVSRVLHGMSYEFSKDFSEKIDLLFIDANHEYEAVRRDYEEWAPHLKPGGLLAFHDVVEKGSCPGPWRVVKEQVRDNPLWIEQRQVDSLYIARKAS
jgi:predicted O-methyltransferase YrrM